MFKNGQLQGAVSYTIVSAIAAPGAETHIEKIPFSCDLAFSRLVKTGNFSTRCLATADTSRKLAAAVPAELPR
jgi:hypothetical protein